MHSKGEELFTIKSQKSLETAIETTISNQKKHVNLFIWSLKNQTKDDGGLLNKIIKNQQNLGSFNLDVESGLYLPLWYPTIGTVISLGLVVLFIYAHLTISDRDEPVKSTMYISFFIESIVILIVFWFASYFYYIDAASMHIYFSNIAPATVIFGVCWGVIGPAVVIVFIMWLSHFTNKDFLGPIARERRELIKGYNIIHLTMTSLHEIAQESLSLGLFMLSSYQLSHSIYFAAIGSQLLPSLIRASLSGLLVNIGLSLWVYLFIAYAYYIPGILLVLSSLVWIGLNFLTSTKPRYDYVILMMLLDSMASVWIAIFVWNAAEMIYFNSFYKKKPEQPDQSSDKKKTGGID